VLLSAHIACVSPGQGRTTMLLSARMACVSLGQGARPRNSHPRNQEVACRVCAILQATPACYFRCVRAMQCHVQQAAQVPLHSGSLALPAQMLPHVTLLPQSDTQCQHSENGLCLACSQRVLVNARKPRACQKDRSMCSTWLQHRLSHRHHSTAMDARTRAQQPHVSKAFGGQSRRKLGLWAVCNACACPQTVASHQLVSGATPAFQPETLGTLHCQPPCWSPSMSLIMFAEPDSNSIHSQHAAQD
jgi:hypothetical protein